MTQANITMLSQQPYKNQFRIGEVLILNMNAFEDQTEYLRFLREANRTPRIGGVYEFRVTRLHGFKKKEGGTIICSPDAPMYIEVEGSQVRFSERLFLKKEH